MFKTVNDGIMPTRGSKYSACVDLYANEDVVIGAGETGIVPLGVVIDQEELANNLKIVSNTYKKVMRGCNRNLTQVKIDQLNAFMKRHYILLEPRSSLRAKGLIVGSGIIDMDYPDELKLIVHFPFNGKGASHYEIKKGDRIAQATLLEHKSYLFNIDTEEKRNGGIGSTKWDY